MKKPSSIEPSTAETGHKLLAGEPLLPAEVERLFHLDAIAQQAVRAAAGRAAAATRRNSKHGQNVHRAINEILDVASLYDQPELDLAIEVRAQLAKRLDELGLTRLPCTKTIIKAIRLRKASSGVLP